MARQYLMQAVSSETGQLVTWISEGSPDFAGESFPGPGDPEEIAVTGLCLPDSPAPLGKGLDSWTCPSVPRAPAFTWGRFPVLVESKGEAPLQRRGTISSHMPTVDVGGCSDEQCVLRVRSEAFVWR